MQTTVEDLAYPIALILSQNIGISEVIGVFGEYGVHKTADIRNINDGTADDIIESLITAFSDGLYDYDRLFELLKALLNVG